MPLWAEILAGAYTAGIAWLIVEAIRAPLIEDEPFVAPDAVNDAAYGQPHADRFALAPSFHSSPLAPEAQANHAA